jgi:pentatricopeptide repeat protein
MRRRAQGLPPLGQFDSEAWLQADDLLKWWASQRTPESVEISFSLLDRFVQELQTMEELRDSSDLNVYLDERVVMTLMTNWFEVWQDQVAAGEEQPLASPLTPEELIDRFDSYVEHFPESMAFRLPGKAVSFLFNARLLRPQPYAESAPFCDFLIDRLLEVTPNRGKGPSAYLINTTLDLWAKSGRPDAMERAENLFARASESHTELDLFSYNSLLAVYAKAGEATKAENLLHSLLQDHWNAHERGDRHPPAPDAISFSTLALAYANAGGGLAGAHRGAYLLKRLMDPFDDYGRLSIPPSSVLLNTILLAYSRTGVASTGAETHRMLEEMKSLDASLLDAISYGTVIDAYSRVGRPDMGERIFQEQMDLFTETKEERYRPNPLTMTLLVSSWAKSGNPWRVERARYYFDKMFDFRDQGIIDVGPDTWAYNTMLACIFGCKSKDMVANAESFLRIMKERAKVGESAAHPNAWTYGEFILYHMEQSNGLNKAEYYLEECDRDPRIEMDIRTVGRMIIAFSKKGWIQKADFWLHKMLDICERESGRPGTQPSPSLLGAVGAGWFRASIKNPDSANRISRLIVRYDQLHKAGVLDKGPDGRVCQLLITCLIRVNSKRAGIASMEVLQAMRKGALNGSPDMMPDTACYQQVLIALVKEKEVSLAHDILQQMISDFREDPRRFPKPDSRCFMTVIERWSEVSLPDAWDKANFLFGQMEDPTTEKERKQRPSLCFRDDRSYQCMIWLAKRSSLPDEAAALDMALQKLKNEKYL